jgi:hypothetical protein
MQERLVKLPELFLVAVTRGMLGFGAGLFASEYISPHRRKLVAGVLVGIGALSTIPLGIRILRRQPDRTDNFERRRAGREPVMTH